MYNLEQNILHRDERVMQHRTKQRDRGGRPRKFDEGEALEKCSASYGRPGYPACRLMASRVPLASIGQASPQPLAARTRSMRRRQHALPGPWTNGLAERSMTTISR